jgi:hypothetical protein
MEVLAWRYGAKAGEKGTQIDLLIDRQDQCINICEIKFSISDFTIDKKYSAELENKLTVFRAQTKTKKALFITMVTTYGIKKNPNSIQIMQNEVIMEDLFK